MTITRPELHEAVAGQKSKASEYNDNFDLMMDYCEDVAEELTNQTNTTLSVYQNVNTLSTSGNITLADNSINTITPTGDVVFELPSISGAEATKYHQILVQVNLETVYDISTGTNYYFHGVEPIFLNTGNYDLIYEYDNVKATWAAGAIPKEQVTQ